MSRKAFIPQLASIERCQEWIRHIRAKVAASHAYHQDPVPNKPDVHHVISKSENFPENILLFQACNSDDPAVKVNCSLPLVVTIADELRTGFYSKFESSPSATRKNPPLRYSAVAVDP